MYKNVGAPTAPATTPVTPTESEIADDEYVSGAQLKRMLAARPQDTSGIELAASTNLSIVQNQHASDFAKYGAEINALIARVPANLRTLDNLKQCVKMVRSDHVDEIVSERAQQLASTMEPTLRSNGAAAPPTPVTREYSLESEKIPAEWRKRAQAAGVTERVVDEFCRANDMTPEAFYKQFDTPLNRIVEDVPTRREA
jgi:hypothetical protein